MPGRVEYPSRAVRYVVPFGAGPTAVQARWLAGKLGAVLGQPIVVENVPGASGAAGTALVARSPADGHVLLAANPGPLTVGPHIVPDPGYDPVRDFEPIVLIATVSSVIAVHPAVPAGSLADLVALARARPGALRHGSPGIGTVGHLAMELLQHMAGIRLAHVPVAGLTEAAAGLAAGAFEVLVIPAPDAQPLAAAGSIRALAATKRRHIASWPGLPTVEEAGVPDFESFNWNGIAAPAGTPGEVVAKVNAAVNDVLATTDAVEYLGSKGYEIAGGTPAAFGAFLRAESEKWGRAVRLAGLERAR